MFYYVLCAAYAAVSIVHLGACLMGNNGVCAITKIVLMPLLALTVVAFNLRGGGQWNTTATLVVLALICGTAGDVLLLGEGDNAFVAGALCFLVGHVCWIMTRRIAIMAASPVLFIVCSICAIVLLFILWKVLECPHGIMGAGVIVYGVCLFALMTTGISSVMYHLCATQVMFLVGAVLFTVSDSILAINKFRGGVVHSRFFVMLTYIVAQTLLASSTVI